MILSTCHIFIDKFGENGEETILFARVIGYIAATLVFVQWYFKFNNRTPQIITTFVNRVFNFNKNSHLETYQY